jgi:hypothetical protein
MKIPDRGASLQRSSPFDAHNQQVSASVFPETAPGSFLLSPEGRRQVLLGTKRCSPADVVYLGDERLRPVSPETEFAFMVRLAFRVSSLLEPRIGRWVDLRPYVRKDALASAGLVLFILLIFAIVTWSSLTPSRRRW